MCTPLSYESLVTSTQFIFEARQCFGRGMIKYNALGFCNLFFKYLETTLWYTIVRLFPNDILLQFFPCIQGEYSMLEATKNMKQDVIGKKSNNSVSESGF